ncbi:MAG: hypothetical protein ACPLKZ_00420 [Candidatus Bathyarchaeales archaeon]
MTAAIYCCFGFIDTDCLSVLIVNKAYFKFYTNYKSGALLKLFGKERKRSRAVILLLLPAVIFLWIVGWGLYWIGHQREERAQKQHSSQKEEYVHFVPVMLEEAELSSK